MENRLFVFAYNENDKCNPSVCYKGHFDGEQFIPKPGFCSGIKDLYEYDYVQLFGGDGSLLHSPKKFNKNLEKEMRRVFIKSFGEVEQVKLF